MTPEQVASRLEPELRAALLAALQDVRDGVDYPALYAAIEAGDIDGVEKALNVEQGSWAPYVAAALAIFMQSGAAAARSLRVRFDPTQDADFRQDLAAKVSAMAAEQVAKAREYVWQGIGEGRPRREIVEGLAGRVSKATGKRQGGVIGLSGAQQSWVDNMWARLASGDPAEIRAALGVKDRDRRYDPLIKRAAVEAKKGAPPVLTPDKIDEITGKYADRLLRKRAKDIASIETTQFAAGARSEVVRQALAKFPGATATKTWHHSSIYLNARLDHVGMSGTTVPFEGVFMMIDGSAMRYAHDPRGGARNNSFCRCRTTFKLEMPK